MDGVRELVLIHGWGMNAGVWEALPPGFAGGRSLRPIELPGHGAAVFDPARRGLPDWTGACLERAPERAVWLGWSLGGLVALQAALQAPERVAALILVTATPRFVQATDWRAAMAAAVFDGFQGALMDDPRATLERFLSLQVRGSDGARETLRRLRAGIGARPEPRPAALAAGLALLRDEDLRARLADIGAPALWLFGARDTLVPAAAAERVARLMPGAHCHILEGAAHAPLLSHVVAADRLIGAFLHEHAP